MSADWHNQSATEKQKEKLRFFGCTWDEGIMAGQADDALEECARQFPDAEAAWQKNQPATEEQTEKLHYFGCTWIGDINFGQASDALLQCASDFPNKEADWQFQQKKRSKVAESFPDTAFEQSDRTSDKNRPVTDAQLDELRSLGREPVRAMTFGEAMELIETIKARNANRHTYEAAILRDETKGKGEVYSQSSKSEVAGENLSWIINHKLPPEPKRTDLKYRVWRNARGKEYGFDLDHLRWEQSVAKIKAQIEAEIKSRDRNDEEGAQQAASQEVTIQEASKPQNTSPSEYTIPAREVQNFAEHSAGPNGKIGKATGREPKRPKYLSYPREPQRQSFNSGLDYDYAYDNAKTNWTAEVKTIEAENRRRHDIYCAAIKSWYVQHNWNTDWEPHPFPRSPLSQSAGQQEDTIQEIVNPRIQKPTAYTYHAPIERIAEWVDGFTERNVTCPDGHWLPAGPLSCVFASDPITVDLCRQMAEKIESRGYCVEPDARFGNGTYDRNQTLALFKPLDGDPIQPSTAYLGAANLLRLCILITTADGKIDLVELDLFRQAIENQAGLTLTDHKRLLILEQLLAQELCSATKTAAKIAKSVPADKRLVIAHLLVQVAAANNEITRDEHRALERIFKAFEIPQVTLENFIYQICRGRATKVYGDVSKNEKWLWNHWRTGHPGVVIDDDTLAGKTWNFTDWKVLNARWRDLHKRLDAKQFNKLPDADSTEGSAKADSGLNSTKISTLDEFLAAGRMLGASGETIQKPVVPTLAKHFALDMERVCQITNETKEVVAILSVVMADEPDESIKLPSKVTLPALDIANVSSVSKDRPPPPRFNGLDAVFHPILERLLTRASWPADDFNALAREFHFMPGKICETINEWSDEALGEFILDGDDPVVIRRELIAKETIYG
jgi:uncharacterized tellurite resistance protein B-like protein